MRALAQVSTAFACLLAAGVITARGHTWIDAVGVVGLIVLAVILEHDRERDIAFDATEEMLELLNRKPMRHPDGELRP
jgi:hypothetical protein